VGSARAADPDAPPGAPANWLPSDPWVQDHWLPYDETRLYQVLGTSRSQLLVWMRRAHDHVPLTVFAREQGVPVAGLAQRLVGPRPAWMSSSQYQVLVYRAGKTLTQPHLIHHMLGHLFHVPPLTRWLRHLLRLPESEIVQLHRSEGLSLAQIAQRQGIDPAALARRALAFLRSVQEQGVALHQTPAAQARLWFALQEQRFPRWFDLKPHPSSRLFAADTGAALYCHLI
jgi:hypothetical protein